MPTLPSYSTLFAAAAVTGALVAQAPYRQFESPQTHPVRLAADGSRLFAVNTADSRLSVFDLRDPSLPILVQEIPVGLEPVSVSPHTADEVWVVNHVSDSISVVSLAAGVVVDTLPVPDEPCDVVFAGNPLRAYVSAARSNAVKVFDPVTRQLVQTIALQGEHPRALAVAPDGLTVYVAFALSGNRTTSLPRGTLAQGAPSNPNLPPAPVAGRIVDAADPAWAPSVIRYQVLDHDVAAIATATNSVVRYFDRLGTVNFGLCVQPGTGDLWVANTDARNLVRFESNLRGHVVDNRLTRVTTGGNSVTTFFDLNPGLDYSTLPNPAAQATALAQPTAVVFEPAGAACWVAAFGSDRVARVAANGTVLQRVEVGDAVGANVDSRRKRGPRGLAMHQSGTRLYVQNRISNTLSVVDTAAAGVLVEVPIGSHDPTPARVREGRGFFYDAKLSGNGTMSCASCHVDGEEDHLAWDLGDPAGVLQTVADPNGPQTFTVHPMKGPMTTQSMKGLAGMAPFHWRGDRVDLAAFNPAFDTLLGGAPLSAAELQDFGTFVESMQLQANPFQLLDRTAPNTINGGNVALGLVQFQQSPSPGGGPNACSSCHSLPNQFVPRVRIQSPGDQPTKVPFMRGYYKKNHFSNQLNAQTVLGFGLEHDGTVMRAVPPGGGFGPITAFFMAFDTGTAPAVGASRTLHQGNAGNAALQGDLATLRARAAALDCDLIVKGSLHGTARGWRYDAAAGVFRGDHAADGTWTALDLQSLAAAGSATLTFLGVLPGHGQRHGVDRDGDGVLDGDELQGFVVYGAGCPGDGNVVPTFRGLGTAAAAAGYSLDVAGAAGGSLALLGFGFGASSQPLVPGCALQIAPFAPELSLGFTLGGNGAGGGTGSLRGVLPAWLTPLDLHLQVAVLDLGAPYGLCLTNALRAAIR